MYFRRIGLHALLGRKDEVEIAKRTVKADRDFISSIAQCETQQQPILEPSPTNYWTF
jgi:hypothetical protein